MRVLCADPPRNMVIRGQLGTGKTSVVAIAMLNRIDIAKKLTQAIFVAASIESACQCADTLLRLGEKMGVRVRLIIQGEECKSLIFEI